MAKNEKDKQTIVHMTQHRKLKNKHASRTTPKTRGDLRCSGRVSRSCFTCGTRRVAYQISNPVNSLIRQVTFMKGKGIVVTTQGTYPISFVKRLFHNGQPTRDGVRKIYEEMISTSHLELLIYQLLCEQQQSIKQIMIGNASTGISYQLGDIYTVCRCCWNVATYKWKVHN